MSALSFMRWAENYHLFILGVLSFASALFGRTAVQRRWHQWPRLHLTGMGSSYIFMLTAFYVDNGKNLPLWRELPQIAFWFLPSAVGVPLILYALLRHPVVLGFGRSLPPASEEELVEALEKTLDCPMTSEAPLSFGGLSPTAE